MTRFRFVQFLLLAAFCGATLPASAAETVRPFERRIVGGEPADIRKHPWQVALNVKLSDGTYLCGGSIIAAKWILTAAHCFERTTPAGDIRVKSNVTNYRTDGIWGDVESVYIHKGYNAKTHENDIALIKLRSAVPGRVIALAPAKLAIPANEPLEVTGWGVTSEEGEFATLLRKASVPYTDLAVCNELASYNGAIKPAMLCAGVKDGGVDSCQGDSGGPLVWRAASGPMLVGVVSWGEGCARKLKYGVYTRVSAYRTWITKTMQAGGK